ncbi:VCBS repeat-containing protein [Salegentibacter sp. JZCK2]|uniref:VCBS repeat-containing protein n=1 Tax=Salegentibacter tibetensis TaxID=2873600 RepID=UPI001CC94411|nr:VCBS repeat-containing protein [Salegentibacter tibetensis]MBZ9729337.1 VCBS repeat-containing protein [Salegentibacter tibetensis]
MKNSMVKTRRLFLIFFLTILFFQACKKEERLFEKIEASYSNIYFSNELDSNSNLNIFNYLYYYNGGGVAAGDYNQDGLIDLYFTSNEKEDKLFLNTGDFKFEDITSASGIDNSGGWTTGVSNVDINGDGLLDLYICKVSSFMDMDGHNLLYVNQGPDEDGIPIFDEQSAKYGLDFSGFSTHAVFLDYDQDGDLDMFLLNHSVHPNRNYGRGEKRQSFDPKSGDRLFRNDDGFFTDVSSESGIFQGVIGYGLGVAVGDLNNDLYPDIYVGNDFFENDYLYINQKNGSFKELISDKPEKMGHTTHFSMGNDIADINNDGLADIISLDMLPEDLNTYKTSGQEYPFQTYANYLKQGFSPQYMQNTLHINTGNLNFSETAYLSGIAATEWSWGVLLADFDNDTHKDIFITNGIKGATNDMDFIRYISNEKIQKQLSQGIFENYEDLIKELPKKKLSNYIFQNQGDNTFVNRKEEWLNAEPTFSHGVVYADLDNDGDLDLVVNNADASVGIFRNNSEKLIKNNYLKVHLDGDNSNKFGIGAKVSLYYGDKLQQQEHYLSRGYLSSLAPGLHFGLANQSLIDSVKVIWPGFLTETRYKIEANRSIKFNIEDATSLIVNEAESNSIFTRRDSLIDYKHVEQSTLEFNREPLIPFGYSNQSPRAAVADINKDGLDDLVIGGGKTQGLNLWLQNVDGSFEKSEQIVFSEDAISEDTDQIFMDVDGDMDLDLIVVSGGNEFTKGKPLQPRLYLNENGKFRLDDQQFKGINLNASRITSVDLNADGFPDVCFSANIVPGEYGKTPRQYLFLNDGNGNFKEVTDQYSKEFKNVGNVQDIIWIDINNDNIKDAIMVGHWMPVTIFLNNGKKLSKLDSGLQDTNGWWNAVIAEDFDGDGDIDIVAGNWGLNSRLEASLEKPLKLYLGDFDGNGSIDPVLSYFYENKETAFASKDELDHQMPFLKKKFPSYKDYADADFSEILPREKLKNAKLKQVFELATCYFENNGDNTFTKHILPFETQVSAIFAIDTQDFNNDGYPDLFLVGNNYEISTQLGRLDASHGTVLINDKNGFFQTYKKEKPDISGAARDIQEICINGELHLIVTLNNGTPTILKINN